jgi:putative membrane protein
MGDPIALPTRAREPARRLSYLDDPRVFFAAERTLLAWQRTAAALIGLGLVIERFSPARAPASARAALASALSFLMTGAAAAVLSLWQYRRLLRELSEPEVPRGYLTWPACAINVLLAGSALATAWWTVISE